MRRPSVPHSEKSSLKGQCVQLWFSIVITSKTQHQYPKAAEKYIQSHLCIFYATIGEVIANYISQGRCRRLSCFATIFLPPIFEEDKLSNEHHDYRMRNKSHKLIIAQKQIEVLELYNKPLINSFISFPYLHHNHLDLIVAIFHFLG